MLFAVILYGVFGKCIALEGMSQVAAGELSREAPHHTDDWLSDDRLLSVVGIPEISPFGFPEILPVGAEVRVVCVPSVKSTLAWFKNDRKLRNGDDGISIQEIQGMLVLTFAAVTGENSGNYTCTGTNQHGVGMFSAYLSVPQAPEWRAVPEARVVIPWDSKPRKLTCEAAGSPRPEITWVKQGCILKTSHWKRNLNRESIFRRQLN